MQCPTEKYVVRFIFYYYDKLDTTCINVYDINVEAINAKLAIENAEKIVIEDTKNYYSPGEIVFVSLRDEKGNVYVLSKKNQLTFLPKENYKNTPKIFWYTEEMHLSIEKNLRQKN